MRGFSAPRFVADQGPMVDESPNGQGAVTYLTVWIVLLFGISANQVVGPLGAVGSPALIVAVGAALLWLAGWLVPSGPISQERQIQPLKIALFVYVWYQLATIVGAHTRSLTPLEQSASVREAITLLALCGISLLIMDGMESIEQLETILRRFVWGAAFLAIVGILQFITGNPFMIPIPGLSANQIPGGVGVRSLFNRPSGTALHAIEFSVVSAALLPLALHYALEGEPRSRTRKRAIVAAIAIGLAVPLSISRSGFVAILGALAVMSLGWTWRRRAEAAIVGLVVVPALWLTIPGLVGTITSMFTSFEVDPSVQARIDRVPRIMALIREAPWFGRGAGTYSVEDYFLVDNEFWVSTIETGIVGICLTIGLFLLAAVMAASSRHHELATRRTSHLGYAIAAGIVGLAVSMTTFDAFFYQIYRGGLFFLIGASGALWRLTRDPPGDAPSTATQSGIATRSGAPLTSVGGRQSDSVFRSTCTNGRGAG